METTPTIARPVPSQNRRLQQALFALLAGVLAVVIGIVFFISGVRLLYWNQALPGVHVAGLDASGMTRPEIELALGERLTYPVTGLIVLQDGERNWLLTPSEIGAVVDIPAMSGEALVVGRRGGLFARIEGQLDAWREGVDLPVRMVFDQRQGRQRLLQIAAEIDQPTVEAGLTLDGLEVLTTPGQIGRRLDIADSLEQLRPSIWQMHDAQVELTIEETPPVVLDASADAAKVRRLLSGPFRLLAQSEPESEIGPDELAARLQFAPDPSRNQFEITFDSAALQAALEPLSPDLARSPENARFIFNDDTRQLDLLEPAVIGRSLDLPASLQSIQTAIGAGESEAELVFQFTEPEVTSDATAESLGITENVVAVSTYFAGSSPERRQNIATASGAFHGLLLAPGDTLSMAEVLGDISLEQGYAEALIIFGDRTIKGVGGGVCQVSTTLFRAAFYGGFQIDERYSHAYRVLYYEQGPNSPGPGLDATVFVPMVDFKFTNDTPHWALLETYIYGNQLLWKIYSTSDGRSVDWTSSGARNVVEAPEPLYRENDELGKGEIEQVDFEADGMDVTVTRTVSRDGQVIHDDVFRTHYLPWRAIYEFGPGTDLPDDAEVE